MINFKKIFVLALVAAGAVFGSADANAQSRKNNRIGLDYALFGDPVPSITSYQLKYNLSPRLQVMGSYGSISASGSSIDPDTGIVTSGGGSVTSYGVAARVHLIPSWSLSPFVGAGYSFSSLSGSFSLSGQTIGSTDKKLNSIVASAGLDHQAFIGFNVGAGINYVITPKFIKDALPIIPFFYFGWFFF